MTDTIIKGSGNSRTIKSVPNIATLAPTYEKFLEYLTGEGFPIDLGPLNATGIDVHGTDLTKANVLTDATATGMGLTSAATPNDAFSKLRSLITTAQSTANTANSTANSAAKTELGNYNGTNSVGYAGKNSITCSITPRAVIVIGHASNYPTNIGIFISGSSVGHSIIGSGNDASRMWQYPLNTTFSGKTVSWYDNSTYGGPTNQLNLNMMYYYIAIG